MNVRGLEQLAAKVLNAEHNTTLPLNKRLAVQVHRGSDQVTVSVVNSSGLIARNSWPQAKLCRNEVTAFVAAAIVGKHAEEHREKGAMTIWLTEKRIDVRVLSGVTRLEARKDGQTFHRETIDEAQLSMDRLRTFFISLPQRRRHDLPEQPSKFVRHSPVGAVTGRGR